MARFVRSFVKNVHFILSKLNLTTATDEKPFIVSDGTTLYQNSRREF
jgi:hypothetical protein